MNCKNPLHCIALSALLIMTALLPASAQEEQTTEIMVFGTVHLQQHDMEEQPIATAMIRNALADYEPDLIAVEWLHPSLYEGTPHRYQPLEDRETLAEVWWLKLESLEEKQSAVRAAIDQLSAAGLFTGDLRVLLGKLYYLDYDPTNAAYQWHLAREAGADVGDVWNLKNDYFASHELGVWGFQLAQKFGHEYLVPFDHQSEDTRWLGNQIYGAVKRAAIEAVDGLVPGDEGYEEKDAEVEALMQELQKGDMTLLERYGGVPAVQEYMAQGQFFQQAMQKVLNVKDPDGLTLIRTLNSEEAVATNRAMYFDYMAKISAENIGQRTVDNYQQRNEKMADYLEADIKRLKSKRVLVIVGLGHKSFLEDILSDRGYSIVASIDYLPGGSDK